MTLENGLIAERFETVDVMQQAIKNLNVAAIDLILAAAKCRKYEPLAAFLLGISEEALGEYEKTLKTELINASRLGVPIMIPRFSDPAVLRHLLSTGFSSPSVLAELTKSMPLIPIASRKRK